MGAFGSPIDPAGGLDVLKEQLIGPFSKKKLKPSDVRTAHARNDFPGGFNFLEIEAGQEKKEEAVKLIGTYMIHAPFEFGGEQKIIKNYYPGQSEPSVQILGPQEADVTVKGRLYDKRFKDDSGLFGIATEFQKQIDAIRIRGNLLRIQLGDAKGGGWQRYGFLQKTMFKMKNKADIEYELQFLIVGFNPPRGVLKINRSNEIPFQIQKALIKKATDLQSNLNNLPKTMPLSFANQIKQLTSDVASATKLVTGFVDTVFSTIDDVKSGIARAQGLIQFAKNKVSDYSRRVGAFQFLGPGLDPSKTGVAAGYSHASFTAGTLSDMTALQQLLAQLAASLAGLNQTVALARHRVIDTDTLQKLALHFYKNQDNWKIIYDHNKLSSTTLVRGSILEIPRI
jgi:hypothetical protein